MNGSPKSKNNVDAQPETSPLAPHLSRTNTDLNLEGVSTVHRDALKNTAQLLSICLNADGNLSLGHVARRNAECDSVQPSSQEDFPSPTSPRDASVDLEKEWILRDIPPNVKVERPRPKLISTAEDTKLFKKRSITDVDFNDLGSDINEGHLPKRGRRELTPSSPFRPAKTIKYSRKVLLSPESTASASNVFDEIPVTTSRKAITSRMKKRIADSHSKVKHKLDKKQMLRKKCLDVKGVAKEDAPVKDEHNDEITPVIMFLSMTSAQWLTWASHVKNV